MGAWYLLTEPRETAQVIGSQRKVWRMGKSYLRNLIAGGDRSGGF
jgi:hypothetical protein